MQSYKILERDPLYPLPSFPQWWHLEIFSPISQPVYHRRYSQDAEHPRHPKVLSSSPTLSLQHMLTEVSCGSGSAHSPGRRRWHGALRELRFGRQTWTGRMHRCTVSASKCYELKSEDWDLGERRKSRTLASLENWEPGHIGPDFPPSRIGGGFLPPPRFIL